MKERSRQPDRPRDPAVPTPEDDATLDQAAWDEFVGRYGPRISAWCRNWGLQEAVALAVLTRLAAKLRGFVYDPRRRSRVLAGAAVYRGPASAGTVRSSPEADAVLLLGCRTPMPAVTGRPCTMSRRAGLVACGRGVPGVPALAELFYPPTRFSLTAFATKGIWILTKQYKQTT